MKKQPRVAILIDTSSGHGRRLLEGIIDYQRECGPWSIIFRSHNPGQPVPSWLRNSHIDGILARVPDQQMAKVIRQRKLAVVDFSYTSEGFGFPSLFTDSSGIVQLAAEHLLDRGFRNFAFCGWPSGHNSRMDERCQLFVQFLSQAGYSCNTFQEKNSRWIARDWEKEQQRIADWLLALPKPVGVMACYDERGQQVLEACQIAKLKVPDEVAVIGVDNDDLICKLSTPALTSVDPGFEHIGYEAAALLDRLMKRKKQPVSPVFYPPVRVIQRQSTDVIAVDDKDLAIALQFIRENASQRISVDDILEVVPISRSSLERRMKKHIGRTPKAEIIRVQLERVKELLAETDLSLAAIAVKSGFEHPQYLAELFKQRFKITPGSYRRSIRK